MASLNIPRNPSFFSKLLKSTVFDVIDVIDVWTTLLKKVNKNTSQVGFWQHEIFLVLLIATIDCHVYVIASCDHLKKISIKINVATDKDNTEMKSGTEQTMKLE